MKLMPPTYALLLMLWTYCAGAQAVERLACSTAAFQRCAMRLWWSLTSNTLQHPLYRLHAPMLAPRDCCKVKRPGKVLHDTAIAYPLHSYPTTQHQPTNESNTILQLTPVLSHRTPSLWYSECICERCVLTTPKTVPKCQLVCIIFNFWSPRSTPILERCTFCSVWDLLT